MHRTTHRATILVIDDSAMIRNQVVEQLTAAGHVIYTAVDGEEGLHLFNELRPDLVVTDVMMPRKDGLSVLRDVRVVDADVAVVVISGSPEADWEKRALQDGANNILRKPFTGDQLLSVVEGLLRLA